MIIQKAIQLIQAFWDYCSNFCYRVEFKLSLVLELCIYFFTRNNLLSPLVLHEFPLSQDTVMVCWSMWRKNVKTRPSQLILSVTYLFDFVAGGKKEGGNSFLPLLWSVLSKMEIRWLHNLNPTEEKKFREVVIPWNIL